MSNLLEQALIDAKALKEAAVKSAEHELLEKYKGDNPDESAWGISFVVDRV